MMQIEHRINPINFVTASEKLLKMREQLTAFVIGYHATLAMDR